MQKRTIIFFLFGVALALAGFHVHAASAAELFAYPREGQLQPGDIFNVDIRLDGRLSSINVVKASISYPVDVLDVLDVTSQGSFLSLWPEIPKVDREAGVITFVGGVPNGSYVIGGRVITISFQARTPGQADIAFNSKASSVYLNDGKGTQASLDVIGATYFVVDELVPTIQIFSSTHPDENTWYPASTVRFTWVPKQGAYYSYVLTKSPFETPDNFVEKNPGKAEFVDVDDGAYYFILKEQIPGNPWRVVGRRKALVDTTPPINVQYKIGRDTIAYNGKIFLAFSASDYASGVDRFDIIEGDEITRDANSPYVLHDQSRSEKLILRVRDKAGNMVQVIISSPQKQAQSISLWLIVIGAIVVIGGIVGLWMRKKKSKAPVVGQ
jgi:hypothetical protein